MYELLNTCRGRVYVPAVRLGALKAALLDAISDEFVDSDSSLGTVFDRLEWLADFDEKGHLVELTKWSSAWRDRDLTVLACVAKFATGGRIRITTENTIHQAFVFDGAGAYASVTGSVAFGNWLEALEDCVTALTRPTGSAQVAEIVSRAVDILKVNQD